MGGMRQVESFRRQAQACANLGSPMYAGLLDRLAADLDDGGAGSVTGRVLAGHEDDPGPSALALRLLGSVHRLVLERRAGELATFYPSVGGTWDLDGGSAAFLRLLDEQPDAVREWLDRPPQTNEVGRAGALMGGLLQLEHRAPVRLFEIGSSGGLNLLADRFAYVDEAGTVHGDPSSVVRLEDAWHGPPLTPWPDLEIVERAGSDVMPVDATTTEGRLTLTAYVWPDQAARLERLRGARALAEQVPVPVRREDAVSFVDGIELREGTTTVLWHSVMWQYLSGDDQQAITRRVEQLGERASDAAPFAHLFLEPTRRTPDSSHEFLVVLTEWPAGRRRILGESVGHGLPTTWDQIPSP
jgi:hypothetical protein